VKGIRRASRRKGNYLWTAVLAEQIPLTAATLAFVIVADGDWQRSSGQSRATLLSIRGYYTIFNVGVLASDFKAYIQVVDEDAPSEAPISVGTYVSEDIMWTGGFSKAASSQSGATFHHEIMNVKAKRKIRTGQECRMVVRASVTSEWQISLVLRGLLKLDAG